MKARAENSHDHRFHFWHPTDSRSVLSGAERSPVPLPGCPLPIPSERWKDAEEPDDVAIGEGVYDFLRQYPDCTNNILYAELLRDAYPHYLADLAAQIVMIDAKSVDAPYVRRKINGLKILALLDPNNPGLWQHLGSACVELGMMFAELPLCRQHFLSAMGYLQRSLELAPDNLAALNQLAQLDYWFGDYPAAVRRLEQLREALPAGSDCTALDARLLQLNSVEMPSRTLINDLEALGETLTMIAERNEPEALAILERLEEDGTLMREMPMGEFYQLLGLCRERCGDLGGAFAAYEQALALDSGLNAAAEGRDRILAGSN